MSDEEQKVNSWWKVIGYNFLAMLAYTLLCRIDIKGGGIIFDCIFVCLHVFIALILAIALKKWEWFFSALIVLIIGFSACVTLLTPGFN